MDSDIQKENLYGFLLLIFHNSTISNKEALNVIIM